jgi:hypothetical protein
LNSQLYREGELYLSTSLFPIIAFHIELTPLVDETYELIQELDGDIFEAQAIVVELTKVPNSDSEEPKSTDSLDTTTGKTRCIFYYFKLCNLLLFTCAFKLLELNENLRCIILGTY